MSYAETSDVEVELGRPASSAAETAQWQAWLDRIERTIARRFVMSGLVLADQVTAGTPTQADVVDVEVAAVLRKIANPTGMTSVTRSVDDASVTTRHEVSGTTDPLALTEDEWSALLPSTSGAFSIDTAPGLAGIHAPWCSLNFGATYCSCGADIAGYPIYEPA